MYCKAYDFRRLLVGICLCISALLLHAHENLIEKIVINNTRVTVFAHKHLHRTYLKENYFAHYADDIKLDELPYSLVTMSFVMNVAPLVWYSGKMYTISEMDEDLYHSLETIRIIFRTFFPSNGWTGAIVPKKLVKNSVTVNKKVSTLTLFSGGVDAIYSVLSHYQTPQLLVTVNGADVPLVEKDMWNAVTKKNKLFAQLHGHVYTVVSSNFASFVDVKKTSLLLPGMVNWWAKTSQIVTYAGLVAPIAFTYGCATILFGSTNTETYPFPHGTHPLLDNAITYAGISVVHDGGDKTRTEKIASIHEVCDQQHLPYPKLRVCFVWDNNGENCSHCEKCLRTIMELFVLKKDPNDYGFTITLDQALQESTVCITHLKNRPSEVRWHWLCIQQEYQKRQAHSFDPKIHAWVNWLISQNIEGCICNCDNRYNDATTKAYTALWRKSLEGSFVLSDLLCITKAQGVEA